ncbi:nitrogenase molybdenum-iron cofactor biosynthesis radical SAM domain iron-sulfur cluster-binding oxidoreductase [Oscillospiraceae bacterium]|nr:nitrogenase molybdenum-iron cofactor biosynthesis radical SAM domain iron-sulfur cluster-binding oxidoreductase [Oscillospiraceae bacterium]BDF75587.1 nitrogenase molybdenum-iron cofactor biosynthesis radical SAM domain iron-sulfur cluster-binding oxidoreductase [Oscillospiraceae bacterium]
MPVLTAPLEIHPCFGGAGHGRYGRIHLPVAPRCNLQCAFCDRRYDCANESRPGVTSAIITPEEAVLRTRRALLRDPRIRVAGIAGPGDPLANRETFDTLRLLRAHFPELILCTSTNGLLLEARLEELLAARLDTLTVTINAVTQETAQRIYTRVQWEGAGLPPGPGARLLLERQRRGLLLCAGAGILVKVNTVLIPGVNGHEIGAIARLAAQAGAAVLNIMPLIPCGQMGHLPPPTPAQLAQARREAGEWIPQFTGCRQCRADACGVV